MFLLISPSAVKSKVGISGTCHGRLLQDRDPKIAKLPFKWCNYGSYSYSRYYLTRINGITMIYKTTYTWRNPSCSTCWYLFSCCRLLLGWFANGCGHVKIFTHIVKLLFYLSIVWTPCLALTWLKCVPSSKKGPFAKDLPRLHMR